jgi:hypothetical protein
MKMKKKYIMKLQDGVIYIIGINVKNVEGIGYNNGFTVFNTIYVTEF